jgi:hypothetical protein
MRKWIWWVAGGVVLLCAVVLLLSWRATHREANPVATPTEIARPPPAAAIQNPVPQSAGAPIEPLPSLEDSDKPLHDALATVSGAGTVDALLRPEMLLRHIVVTIDNLPRKRAAIELRPTKPVPGHFLASGEDQSGTLDPANFERYAPYVQAAQSLDPQRLAAVYFRFYPLFQQAYQSLGYPNGYFNDRLVAVIDDLLATPEVQGPIALVRPNVMYQFADPKLEELSAGQKLLLRMGPENAAIIKAKLRELRGALANRRPGATR